MTYLHYDFANLMLAAEKLGLPWLSLFLQRRRESKRKAALKRKLGIS